MNETQQQETKPEQPTTVVRLVFTGVDFDAKGKRFWDYREVEGTPEDPALGKTRSYAKSLLPGYARPGAMFTIEQKSEAEGRVQLDTVKMLDRWPDDAQRARWQAESAGKVAAHEEGERMKELVGGNALAERLEPIRAAYRSTSAGVRRQILAEVIRYVTT